MTSRKYDDSKLQKRPVKTSTAVTVHQSSSIQQSGLDTADMQPKQRNREMVRGSEQREPAPTATERAQQRDNWYRDDWFSRQDNTWQHETHRDGYGGQYGREPMNRRRSPSPERGWEVDLGGGGGYYRYVLYF